MSRTVKRVFSFVLSFVLCISLFAGVTIVKPKNGTTVRHSLIVIAYADAEEAETPPPENNNDAPSGGDSTPADTVTATVETQVAADVPDVSEAPPVAEAANTDPAPAADTTGTNDVPDVSEAPPVAEAANSDPSPAADTPSTNDVPVVNEIASTTPAPAAESGNTTAATTEVTATETVDAPVAAGDAEQAVTVEEVKSDAPVDEVKEIAVDTKEGAAAKTGEPVVAAEESKEDKTEIVVDEGIKEEPVKTEPAAKGAPAADDDVDKDVNKSGNETKEEAKADAVKEGGAKNVNDAADEVKEEAESETANTEESTKKGASAEEDPPADKEDDKKEEEEANTTKKGGAKSVGFTAVEVEEEAEAETANTEESTKKGAAAEEDPLADKEDDKKEESKDDTTKKGGAKSVGFTAAEVKEEPEAETANIEANTKKGAAATNVIEEEDEENEEKKEDSTTPVAEVNAETEPITEPVIKLNKSADNTESEQTREQSLEDILPPELLDLILSKTDLEVGGTDVIVADVYAVDDVSGFSDAYVVFKNEETGKTITTSARRTYYVLDENGYIKFDSNGNPITAEYPNGAAEGEITADSTLPSGDYKIYRITVYDNAGNSQQYSTEYYDPETYSRINNIPAKLQNLKINLINNGVADILAPILQNLTLSKTTLETGGTDSVTADVYATDDASGLSDAYVIFKNDKTGKTITTSARRTYYVLDENGYIKFDSKGNPITAEYPDGAAEGIITADQYLPSGDYKIYRITVYDNAGNSQQYSTEYYDPETHSRINNIPASLRNLTINVINQAVEDILAPVLKNLTLSKTTLETGEKDSITADVYATDDASGLSDAYVIFKNDETGKTITTSAQRTYYVLDENGYIKFDSNGNPITAEYPNGAAEGIVKADTYLPSGDYKIYRITVYDNAGNSQQYSTEYYDPETYSRINNIPDFLRNLYITVINNGYIKPKPAPQPTGYTVTDYIPEVPSQGEVTTGSVSNAPGYDVDISESETYVELKNELLTTEERLQVAKGKDVKITLEFTLPEMAASDVKLVENAIGSGTIATWLDISVFKQIEGLEKIKIDKPNGKVKLQITAPDEIIALAAAGVPFELIRIVDGEVVRIPATYNAKTNTIDFETDAFGVFALVYGA